MQNALRPARGISMRSTLSLLSLSAVLLVSCAATQMDAYGPILSQGRSVRGAPVRGVRSPGSDGAADLRGPTGGGSVGAWRQTGLNSQLSPATGSATGSDPYWLPRSAWVRAPSFA